MQPHTRQHAKLSQNGKWCAISTSENPPCFERSWQDAGVRQEGRQRSRHDIDLSLLFAYIAVEVKA